ncbi:hypothetical protein EGW08_017337 [Elysia chlorotica]|uniref:Uncharacterized protein n=1 Tax=Elysia chlorotica TaxID=188477 RepID=A0A3S1H9K2_ELYCH|nr:hypothetical protein EGW08_017337 [Elysia chlorotica]
MLFVGQKSPHNRAITARDERQSNQVIRPVEFSTDAQGVRVSNLRCSSTVVSIAFDGQIPICESRERLFPLTFNPHNSCPLEPFHSSRLGSRNVPFPEYPVPDKTRRVPGRTGTAQPDPELPLLRSETRSPTRVTGTDWETAGQTPRGRIQRFRTLGSSVLAALCHCLWPRLSPASLCDPNWHDTRSKRQEARSKKQEARSKKQEARGKKQEARGKKLEARGKKQEARSKKQEARSKKQEARGKKQEARGKKQEARSKKQEARSKKQEARSKKQEARSKKQEARSKKQEARSKKQEAKIKKQEARSKKQEARNKRHAETMPEYHGLLEH